MALSFAPQQKINIAVETEVGPTLVTYKNKVYAAWKGLGADSDFNIYYVTYDGTSWDSQRLLRIGFQTDWKPGLGVLGETLVAAWKGVGADENIYYSTTTDGSTWAAKKQIPGVGTTNGPSLAPYTTEFGELVLYAAWKGSGTDERIWYSIFNGTSWTPQKQMINGPPPGFGSIQSSIGPSLTYFDKYKALYAAWKGAGNDQTLWVSEWGGYEWWPQSNFRPGIFSSIGPSLAVFNGNMYAAWKGEGNDQRIFYTIYYDTYFGTVVIDGKGYIQVPLPSPIGTSVGPSMAALGDQLIFSWKGEGNDNGIYWTVATLA
jgi:hypothetical protein